MKNEELNQIIDKSFRTTPDLKLPVDFAQKLTMKVIGREQWKTDLRDYLLMCGVFLSLLLAVFCFYYFIDNTFVTKTIVFLSGNLIPIVSGVLLLNFIFFVDKVLLRYFFSRHNRA